MFLMQGENDYFTRGCFMQGRIELNMVNLEQLKIPVWMALI